jgi:hypothetical protein
MSHTSPVERHAPSRRSFTHNAHVQKIETVIPPKRNAL